ncbi:hypothetical protein BV25DRAFT_1843295 [Artomyces pyxidatus]|uniref:Uncharacterized protein n=1 Tax=Artomyces pyxidatus TaxID=48021 RepID=A0ACB8SF30_9AGAM|nr:hypothetical protein BV25DRAFT_1843295 [Artomyces pyxidatus]
MTEPVEPPQGTSIVGGSLHSAKKRKADDLSVGSDSDDDRTVKRSKFRVYRAAVPLPAYASPPPGAEHLRLEDRIAALEADLRNFKAELSKDREHLEILERLFFENLFKDVFFRGTKLAVGKDRMLAHAPPPTALSKLAWVPSHRSFRGPLDAAYGKHLTGDQLTAESWRLYGCARGAAPSISSSKWT